MLDASGLVVLTPPYCDAKPNSFSAIYASISGIFWNSLKVAVMFAIVATSFVSTMSIGSRSVDHSRSMLSVHACHARSKLQLKDPSMLSRFTAWAPVVDMVGI